MTHIQTTCSNRIALRARKKGARPIKVWARAPMFEKSAKEPLEKITKKQTHDTNSDIQR